MSIHKILAYLRPGEGYALTLPVAEITNASTYRKAIDWRFDGTLPPTYAEIVAAWPAVEARMRAEQAAKDLAASDAAMARVSEAAISVLIAKGVLAISDLDKADQDVLTNRASLRAKT